MTTPHERNSNTMTPTTIIRDARTTTLPDAMELRHLIERVDYATSSDPGRYNLNGVFLERGESPDQVIATATDGHRLAQARAIIPGLPLPARGVIVEADALKALKKHLHKKSRGAKIRSTVHELPLGFEFADEIDRPGFVVSSDATFPNYRQVIPTKVGPARQIPREAIEALRELAGTGGQVSGRVTIEVRPDVLVLTASRDIPGGEIGGRARFELDPAPGFPVVTMNFNGHYLADALEGVPAAALRAPIEVYDPALVVPATPSAGEELAVVMPMRA